MLSSEDHDESKNKQVLSKQGTKVGRIFRQKASMMLDM